MVYWIAVTALATVGILIFAWSNYNLAKEIKETREKHDQETNDLFQAIVVANIASGPHIYSESLKFFKNNYKGKTEIPLPWPAEGQNTTF